MSRSQVASRRLTGLAVSLSVLLLIVGCQTTPIVLVATQIPLDNGFRTYSYNNGVFSLRLPPNWSVRDVSANNAIQVEFAPPDSSGLPLTVYVINTGKPIDSAALLDALKTYPSVVDGGPDVYSEVSRTAQGDGSWRLTGIRHTSIGDRQLDTFVQATQSFLSVLVVDVTDADDNRMSQLTAIVNTYQVNPTSQLTISNVNAVAPAGVDTSSGSLTFSGLSAWTDTQGAFNVEGDLTNKSGNPLEAIRVTALLYDNQNNVLTQEGVVLDADMLAVDAASSFAIQFHNGKPSQAVRYVLQASARNAQSTLQTTIDPTGFLKGNEKAFYDSVGNLVVSGDVVNQTKAQAHAVRVQVTVYDTSQNVIGTQTVFLDKPDLLPGEVGHYQAAFPSLAGGAARFVTRAEGRTTP